MSEQACVYMMANRRQGTIYLGSAIDLPKRVWEHRNAVVPSFTRRYGCKLLVWYEVAGSWEASRLRERQMKDWKRAWKIEAIERMNPDWFDLYERIAAG